MSSRNHGASSPLWPRLVAHRVALHTSSAVPVPSGHPPKATTDSIACKNVAILLPSLARVQIGQRCSQKSGANTIDVLLIHYEFPLRFAAEG
jgi:hypothetical protein